MTIIVIGFLCLLVPGAIRSEVPTFWSARPIIYEGLWVIFYNYFI